MGSGIIEMKVGKHHYPIRYKISHTYIYIYICIYIYIIVFTSCHACHGHSRYHIIRYIDTRSHTRTHTQAHTHAHTQAHTHTHEYVRSAVHTYVRKMNMYIIVRSAGPARIVISSCITTCPY